MKKNFNRIDFKREFSNVEHTSCGAPSGISRSMIAQRYGFGRTSMFCSSTSTSLDAVSKKRTRKRQRRCTLKNDKNQTTFQSYHHLANIARQLLDRVEIRDSVNWNELVAVHLRHQVWILCKVLSEKKRRG